MKPHLETSLTDKPKSYISQSTNHEIMNSAGEKATVDSHICTNAIRNTIVKKETSKSKRRKK